jgi:hypothetical protein
MTPLRHKLHVHGIHLLAIPVLRDLVVKALKGILANGNCMLSGLVFIACL